MHLNTYFLVKNTGNIWLIQKIVVPLHPLIRKQHRGVEQLVARQAHNLEVACSSPASATTAAFLGCFYFIVSFAKEKALSLLTQRLFLIRMK